MSLECSECERDLRGGHDPECSRHPVKMIDNLINECVLASMQNDLERAQEAREKALKVVSRLYASATE